MCESCRMIDMILEMQQRIESLEKKLGGKRAGFKEPTSKDVSEYCKERSNDIDPLAFVDYYSARGWMLNGRKMRDWKAAIRTWERNSKPKTPKVKASHTAEEAAGLFND